MITTVSNRYQSSLLKCANCKALGAITWETSAQANAPQRLVKISGEFHIETGRTVPDCRLIVCTLCDEVCDALPIA